MSDARPLAIVNPNAGGGGSALRPTLPALVQAMERALGPVDVVETERPGHAIALAREAAMEGRARLLAVGGDGTVHEVANGILEAQRAAEEADGATAIETTLGIVGRGTGSDLARTLGIGADLESPHGCLATIARGRVRAIDVGEASYGNGEASGERYFVNILSAGLSGLVDRIMVTQSRALGSRASYFAASARALLGARRAKLRVRYVPPDRASDVFEETALESYLVAVCNGRYFGAGMHVAPMADPTDGRFEVVSIDAPGKIGFALTTRRIWNAGHMGRAGVTHFSCRRLRLELVNEEAADRFVNDVDGEPLGGLPLSIGLVPAALRVFA